MIDNLEEFFAKTIKVSKSNNSLREYYYIANLHFTDLEGSMYCPKCRDIRLMSINLVFKKEHATQTNLEQILLAHRTEKLNRVVNIPENEERYVTDTARNMLTPSLWSYLCLQCKTLFTSLVHYGQKGISLIVIPTCNAGIATTNTPESVVYYLSQAALAKSAGANSAAMAMYRAALEQILYEQAYADRMLGPKINHLCEDIKKGCAPDWALKLETDFLSYMNKIGNGAIHANDGDMEKQKAIDNELLSKIDVLFSMLLYRIYEAKKQQEEWLNSLNNTAAIFDK